MNKLDELLISLEFNSGSSDALPLLHLAAAVHQEANSILVLHCGGDIPEELDQKLSNAREMSDASFKEAMNLLGLDI